MAQLDMTAFSYALKTQYSPDKVQNMTLQDQPALALMPKFERFKGANHVFVAKYTDVPSASHDFATAQSLKSNSAGKSFTLTRKKDYALASIDNETIEASEGDEGAFLAALQDEMDSAIHALKRRMGIAIFGDGSAKIGTIGTSGVSTTTVTLSDAEDISNFEPGMELVCATATSAAPINGGASVGISSVDRDAGTITMDEDVSALGTAWTDTYVLFQKGDYVAASDVNRMMGFAGWIPDSAPSTTETWCNCNRSTDATRLAGVRQDLSGYTLPEGLVRLHTAICRQGGGSNMTAFCSFSRMEELINVMGSKAIPVEVKSGHANIGFPGFKVIGPRGTVTVIADVNCPGDHLYMLDLSMWKLMSLGPAPKILKYKGSGLQVETTNDGVEIRVGYYAQTKCAAPVRNGVGTNFGS